jgi:hypothetical protein
MAVSHELGQGFIKFCARGPAQKFFSNELNRCSMGDVVAFVLQNSPFIQLRLTKLLGNTRIRLPLYMARLGFPMNASGYTST